MSASSTINRRTLLSAGSLLGASTSIGLLTPAAAAEPVSNKASSFVGSTTHGGVAVPIKQTAGRTRLGDFAPTFARLNDDVLFGEVWSRNDVLSLRDRSVVTVVALMRQGLVDSSFR